MITLLLVLMVQRVIKSSVHPAPSVERFDNRSDLIKEPRLRSLVGNECESVLISPRLVGEADACIFHSNTLDLSERQVPF